MPATAVAMPLLELGIAAVDALVRQIREGTREDVVVGDRPPELVLRESTAPPGGR